MKVIVLGMGLQGKAVIHDLESSSLITEIFAADLFLTEKSLAEADVYLTGKGYSKTRAITLDVSMEKELLDTISKKDIDIIICMLPIQLALTAARAAVEAGIPFVSSNYTYELSILDDIAKEKNTIILPEMGLDPGIDLVLGRLAMDELDVVYGINSYGGGIPAPECAENSPIKYKISWIFDRVLDVYVREARFIKNGQLHVVPGNEIFKEENVHEIEFSGIGTVEAYLNGDAERYVEIFGLGNELVEMGRYALRWPVSPRAFLAKCLTPKLQYTGDEKDVALLRVEAWGLKDTKKVKVTYDLIDYRDLETGLFAMNRTVGFTASIAALMILSGKITQSGVLSPVRHVPPHEFIKEVEARGMRVKHKTREMD